MTERTDYIMNKMKEIIELYFEIKSSTKDFEVDEVDIKHYITELEIGVDKLKELIK